MTVEIQIRMDVELQIPLGIDLDSIADVIENTRGLGNRPSDKEVFERIKKSLVDVATSISDEFLDKHMDIALIIAETIYPEDLKTLK